jgi:N-acetylglucosaminyldiphosphoundecaprenol N-acetyl-beta-D-mannosaminyltransferase
MKEILFDNITYNISNIYDFIDFLHKHINENSSNKLILVHINLRNYYYLNKDVNLKKLLSDSCFVIFEGIGMKTAFFFRGYGKLPDLNGTDSFPLLMEKISGSSEKLFLLGSNRQNVELSAEKIRKQFPLIEICGCRDGYFSIEEEKEVVDNINKSGAKILLIGRGFPLQEEFVMRNKDVLKPTLIWNVGGLFDTLSGSKRRAPIIYRKLRLEWMYRMMKEPRRMIHRNSVAAVWSIFHILFLKQKL